MSSNFNNAKIINVYYNKGDRKPYDVNGKPIAYIGEEFVGANEATKIRFFLGEELDSGTAFIVAKRANNETRIDQLALDYTIDNEPYYEISLNAWYAEYKGKMTIIFKAYNGTVTFNEANTEIVSVSGRIVVSDIFNLEVAYAPLATSTVPPYDPDPEESWYFALSQKLDKAQSITVSSALPTSGELADNALNNRYFYVQTEGVGRLYYIDGSSPIEVVWGIGTLALASNGNEDINVGTNAGKMYWDSDRGTIIAGLYDDQEAGIGDSLFFFGKATEAIAKGEVVQFAGNTGGNIRIKKAVFAQISAQPDLLMGVAKHAIALNDFGYVVSFGYVRNLNTTAFTTPILYLSTSVDGALSSTKPTTGFKGSIAAVARPSTDGANGFLIVRPNLVKGIGDLADVTITNVQSGQILRYDESGNWENDSALTVAESDIDALEGRMDTAESDIDSLEGRMTTAESNIVNIEDGTTVVQKALSDQNNDVIDTTYLKIASATATYIPLSQKGVANGVAPLGSDNKIPSIHLPGGVDDIKEFADVASFPDPGEASIIYVALDTNVIYRWSGTAYVEISSSLALGQTSSTAFPGDRGLALETLTDNIVDGSQALALKDQIIRNTLTTTIPLVVNSIASTTANLTEFQVNGAKVLEVTPVGGLNQNGARLFSQPVNDTNTLFGSFSGGTNTTGTNNTALGRASLNALTSGGNNTALGISSGRTITTGGLNTFVGTSSGFNASQLATASNSTALGFESFTDKSNQMVFGNASVTEFKFDRNTGAIALLPRVNASAADGHVFESTTTATDSIGGNLVLRRTTTNAMADGFGYGIIFQLRDSDNVDNSVVRLQVARSGADNSGRLLFSTMNTGTLTEKMTILPDGKVGIGTASPATILSVITGSNTDGIEIRRNSNTENDYGLLAFRVATTDGAVKQAEIRTLRVGSGGGTLAFHTYNGTAGNSPERMRIRDDGNVGIGTSSPVAKLQLSLSTAPTTISKANTYIGVGSTENANNSYRLIGFGYSSTTNNYPAYFGYQEKNNSGETNGDFVFLTRSVTTNTEPSERMRILANGNVGIGTSSPATLLDVSQALDGTTLRISSQQNNASHISTTPYGSLEFFSADNSGAGAGNRGSIKVLPTGAAGAGARMTLSVASNDTLDVERLRINEDGLVGINETSPTAQLVVKSGAVDRVPLIVNTLASQTANLAEFKLNGANKAYIENGGMIRTGEGIANITTSNNSRLLLGDTGAIIRRNINDANPALIVNLENSSATGNIQVWQKAGSALSQISNAGIFVGQSRPTRTDITANATLALADEGKVLRVNSASNLTVTIPLNSSVAFPTDTEIAILRYGTGTVSISPTAGVTLNSVSSNRKVKDQYGSVALKKIGENEWVLVGSLEA
jgi:hypothetical protein